LCFTFSVTLQAQQAVSLSMIVTDKNNKSVNTIRKDQIRVFEDKAEQQILSIEPDERPVDYGIVMDASGSFRRLLMSSLEAVTLILKNKRPTDEIFIERFISSDKIEKYEEFNADGAVLIKSLDGFKLEGGQSAVIDALSTAVNYVDEHNKANEGRRKVVIIITDGEDRASFYKKDDLIKLLHETGVQVFVLGLVTELDTEPGFTRPGARDRAEKLLKSVANESGGRLFLPKDKQQLMDSAAQIILDLRGQFRIKYQSTGDPAKNGFHDVDVKFVSTDGEKLSLVVPPGYFTGPRTPVRKQEKKP
jgi:Ca-activated chloride channel homolog